MARTATVKRETSETRIELSVDLDGGGGTDVSTGVPFFDHMMDALGRHASIGLTVHAQGDTEVDAHHTVEDVGICFGSALTQALGDKSGITRFGSALVPMDEALVVAALDVSGRPYLAYEVDVPIEIVGTFDTTLAEEFMRAGVSNAGFTLHLRTMAGGNSHHVVEAVFK